MPSTCTQGPLTGVRIVEFLGLGPGPFACMLLADLGAEVISIARPRASLPALVRNRPIIQVDLKDEASARAVHELIAGADALIEGFRPGVMERLGLGPDVLHAKQPELIYARMTGWGQTGRLAETAGHDINYIALTGALHHASRRDAIPTPPTNLLGDFGGGGMYLVMSVLAALMERNRTGKGQVLDIAILDGVTYLTSMLHEYRADGRWSDVAGTNRLDTGAPYYDVYPCADGLFVAVGALEDAFFAELLTQLDLDPAWNDKRHDPAVWSELRTVIGDRLLTRTRDEWAQRLQFTDACVTPILTLNEAASNHQVASRQVLVPRSNSTWTPRLPLGFCSTVTPAAAVLDGWDMSESTRSRLLADHSAESWQRT